MRIQSTFAALAVLALAGSAHANLVTNGDFSSNAGVGQINWNTSAADWTVGSGNEGSGYTFIYKNGQSDILADNPSNDQYGYNLLWGSHDSGFDPITAPPSGAGYFIAQDGDFQPGAITQTISVVMGKTYAVTFDYAYAQQANVPPGQCNQCYGDTKQKWNVQLGGSPIQSTMYLTNPSQSFTGWFTQTMDFTALTSGSEVLSFAAFGTHMGSGTLPPFALLTGVDVSSSVPEPATWAMMIVGVGGLGALARRRRAAAIAA